MIHDVGRAFAWMRIFFVLVFGLTFLALQISELQAPWQQGPWWRMFEGWLVCYFAWFAGGCWQRTARIAVCDLASTGTPPTPAQIKQLRRRWLNAAHWSPREWLESPSQFVEFLVLIAVIAITWQLPELGGGILVLTAAHAIVVLGLRISRSRSRIK
ncbi:MAG: hypothetical protein WD069_02770 [Planctomycetales bacterium]